jgi:outer membrane lipoprotein-sorting protein
MTVFLFMLIVIAYIFSSILFAEKISSNQEELSPNQIVSKSDGVMFANTAELVVEMKVIRPNQQETEKRLKVYIKGNNKAFVRYLFPPREEGTGYLLLDKDVWMYIPGIERSVRVNSKERMRGTDFSNTDILRVRLSEDYEATLIGKEKIDEDMVYILHLKAKDTTVAYDKVKYWVRVRDFMPIREEFLAISGKLLKALTFREIKEIGGRIRPTELVMEDMIQNGYKTILNLLEAKFDIEILEKVFTKLYLEKNL